MIKKFNENWGPLKGGSRRGHFPIIINATESDSLNYSIERALRMAKKENSDVILKIDGFELEVNPESIMDDIINEYQKLKKFQDNSKDYWKDYWEQKSSDPDFEMDTIDDYAMRNSISRIEAEKHFKNSNVGGELPFTHGYLKTKEQKFEKGDIIYDYIYKMNGKIVDYNPNKEDSYLIDFEDGTSVWLPENGLAKISTNQTPVIGLPSGQILYMNKKQLTYFKERKKVIFKKVYYKTVGSIIVPMDLNQYTFMDKDYNEIIDTINIFIW